MINGIVFTYNLLGVYIVYTKSREIFLPPGKAGNFIVIAWDKEKCIDNESIKEGVKEFLDEKTALTAAAAWRGILCPFSN